MKLFYEIIIPYILILSPILLLIYLAISIGKLQDYKQKIIKFTIELKKKYKKLKAKYLNSS